MTTKLGKYVKHFEEMSIRLDQSFKDGKTILSTRTASSLYKDLAGLVKEISNLSESK